MRQIGICIGSTRPNRVYFITDELVRIGQFVTLSYTDGGEKKNLLGMIQSLERDNPYLPETIKTTQQAESIKKFSEKENTIKGEIHILGEIIGDRDSKVFLQIPRTPPLPASEVFEASPQLLKVFGAKSKKFVRIGRLLSEREEVPVYVDVEQIVLRHLAVLAVTGAGKSNTVSVLLKNIINLGGTVAVFDFHRWSLKSKLTRNGKKAVNHIHPLINPASLKPKEFASFIGIKPNAYVQFRYFQTCL
ncbi:MAG: DUF87 domain-containing protein [Persephonella sp.]|nr:DUF87 domain-containing protein [Persephonella sp.]